MKHNFKRILSTILAGAICSACMLTGAASGTTASAASNTSGGVVCSDQLGDGHIVFYPESLLVQDEATYPVIVWANGTMCAPALYYSLLSDLAADGYIVVASCSPETAEHSALRLTISPRKTTMLRAFSTARRIFRTSARQGIRRAA